MITLDFTLEQEAMLDRILEWRASGWRERDPYLTLGGYAGTGKTTLISYLAERWARVAILALCGKAVHVLRAKGARAQTIHNLLYVPYWTSDGKLRFRKRHTLDDIETMIVDEASMIDHVLCMDILSFRVPVLFVGDHGQLEPIGTNANLMVNPMLRLETVHRQARDNPILRLATAFREGRAVPFWKDPHGRLEVVSRRRFDHLVSPNVQIICGFNKTRHQVNARVRALMGNSKELVAPGEKLICLKNNRAFNIFNGQQFTVVSVAHENKRTIDLKVEADDGRILTLPCLRQQFGQEQNREFRSNEAALMDFGYCLTAHKAQGSEWDSVLVLEEIFKDWDPRRWRYTVVTRAKERLIYCR